MSDDLLFREVDEEVRQEQYKKIWERYGNYLIALCAVVVLAVGGFKGWQYWQLKQSEAAAGLYFAAAKLAASDKAEEALKQYAAIEHAGFGQLARLRQAGALASLGKPGEAVKLYDALAADGGADPALRELAQVRAGYLLADSLTPAELQKRLASLETEGNPWRHAVLEITGLSAWRVADYGLADKSVKAIIADPLAPAALRQRAQQMADLLAPLLDTK